MHRSTLRVALPIGQQVPWTPSSDKAASPKTGLAAYEVEGQAGLDVGVEHSFSSPTSTKSASLAVQSSSTWGVVDQHNHGLLTTSHIPQDASILLTPDSNRAPLLNSLSFTGPNTQTALTRIAEAPSNPTSSAGAGAASKRAPPSRSASSLASRPSVAGGSGAAQYTAPHSPVRRRASAANHPTPVLLEAPRPLRPSTALARSKSTIAAAHGVHQPLVSPAPLPSASSANTHVGRPPLSPPLNTRHAMSPGGGHSAAALQPTPLQAAVPATPPALRNAPAAAPSRVAWAQQPMPSRALSRGASAKARRPDTAVAAASSTPAPGAPAGPERLASVAKRTSEQHSEDDMQPPQQQQQQQLARAGFVVAPLRLGGDNGAGLPLPNEINLSELFSPPGSPSSHGSASVPLSPSAGHDRAVAAAAAAEEGAAVVRRQQQQDAGGMKVMLRVPKWLRRPPVQAMERLRTGRLGELAERVAACTQPTVFDLGGLEYSGYIGSSSPAGLSASHVGTPQAEPSGSGRPTANLRARRMSAADARAGLGFDREQVLRIPPGVHITLYNATLLLTADQYVLVGPGAGLTLKGTELIGCSREAGSMTSAVRRHALSRAAAAQAAAAATRQQLQQHLTLPENSPATGAARAARLSSPGHSARPSMSGAPMTPTSVAGSAVAVRRPSIPGQRTPPRVGAPSGVGAGAGSVSGDGQTPQQPRRRTTSSGGERTFGLSTPGAVAGAHVMSIPPHDPVHPHGSAAAGGGLRRHSQSGGGVGAGPTQMTQIVDPLEYVDSHALLEVQGGFCRLSNCAIAPGRPQMSICVSDAGSCEVTFTTSGPVCAAGERSVLVLKQSVVEGGAAGCAASVLDGAGLRMHGCEARGAGAGGGAARSSGGGRTRLSSILNSCGGDVVEVRGAGSRALLRDCDVASGRACGVVAAAGAAVELAGSRVRASGTHGVHVWGAGSTLTTSGGCRMEDNWSGGVCVGDAATATLTDTSLLGTLAGPGLVVSRTSGPLAGGGGGAAALAAALVAAGAAPRAVLRRCALHTNAGDGVAASNGAHVELIGCELYNNLYCGLAVQGAGTGASCSGSSFIKNDANGVRAEDSGRVLLSKCTISTNARDGIALEGPGTRGELTQCESRDNHESGVCVAGSAVADLCDSRLADNQHDGLAVGGAGSVTRARRCTFSGNLTKGAGVYMGGTAEMLCCSAHNNVAKCMQVGDKGSRLILGKSCSLDRQPVVVNGGRLVHA